MPGNIFSLDAKWYGLPMIIRLNSFPLKQSGKVPVGKGPWLVLITNLCWELLERLLVGPGQNHARDDPNGVENGIFISRTFPGIVYFTHTDVICDDGRHISTLIRGPCLYLPWQVELCEPLICKIKLWGASPKSWDIDETLSSVFIVAPGVIKHSL